jgi:hypothetical protein
VTVDGANVTPDETITFWEARIVSAGEVITSWEARTVSAEESSTFLEARIVSPGEVITSWEGRIVPVEESITSLEARIVPAEESITSLEARVVPAEEVIISWEARTASWEHRGCTEGQDLVMRGAAHALLEDAVSFEREEMMSREAVFAPYESVGSTGWLPSQFPEAEMVWQARVRLVPGVASGGATLRSLTASAAPPPPTAPPPA